MKGDFSRDTFDPLKHFSRVLLQQGRVQLDADTNEQTAILLHYLRTLVTDLIGSHAGPNDNSGFLIDNPSKKDFSIGKGRYYVAGILCENDTDITYKTQKDYPHPPELEEDVPYLVYLDVWERHITALEDDYIREKALGGPDTATRTKVICQVKVDKGEEGLSPSDCVTVSNNWKEKWINRWQPANRGSLKACVTPQKDSKDPCLIAPDSRYRGQENQLYRIEIHKGSKGDKAGEPNSATFKWSRDNGAVVSKVLEFSGKELTVEKTLGFEPKIWVELSNDDQELRGEPGSLAKLVNVEGNRFILESAILRPAGISTNEEWPTKVRRWDQRYNSNLIEGAIPITEDKADWIEIENGIEIQFVAADTGEDSHHYRTGDFWLISARVATGDIEWVEIDEDGKPKDEKNPIARELFGIQHHYAPLAILNMGQSEPPDCRCKFEPLKNDCDRSGTRKKA
ncbi:hypothetical protein C8R34_1564 [Nitrosomonas sp. Nm84]|uniref:DUF6519 domain-containing protein n=1 Tax=Nitrosomonas sp. Nm84 TaxID=200124 RepID=UPI000D76529D|nr:DUF6519 domain-containing protein [Nitrosomonas sp. Nm84]PXW79991.1 hypothetical protein C8R34_1564 [Nitrosomonas sp. Nm84]